MLTWQGFAEVRRATPWGEQKSINEKKQAKHRVAEDALCLSPDEVHLEYLFLNAPGMRSKREE